MHVDKNRCPQNHKCPAIKVCDFEAISQEGFSLPKVDESKCTNCGRCVAFCPMSAIG